ncbi:protein TsetseEP-like isoform X3 [Drosophila novamexicana]|uniref:protein TsetseEP-like isoform X3 n=1 Tax=Drosophila novamexicana TaxID=47314 RepID=UPI0011E5EEB8|nr:protein TsetseEP-like isoform X3 [Drosophila novamexicana]
MIIVMYYDQSDERSYIYYVKLPEIEHKFAIGCKNLRSANVGYIIDLARDVAERNRYEYTDDPTVFCHDIGKIVIDNTALAFCISKGYTFEVFNGIKEVKQEQKQEPKDEPKVEPKEEPKDEPKQEAKEERNEEPTAEPADEPKQENEEGKVLAEPESKQ